MKKIIIISANNALVKRVKGLYRDTKITINSFPGLDQLLKKFKTITYDIVMIAGDACKEPGLDYISILKILAEKCSQSQVIFLVEQTDIDIAIEALKVGSFHYLKFPATDEELKLLIETAIERKPQYGENIIKQETHIESRFGQLVGISIHMRNVYNQIRQASVTNIPVLIVGETGTGKDLVALEIHKNSKRNNERYLPVSLGALPTELIASELFGHEKGSFTGAIKQHKGVFEQADKGTVFLDEIDTVEEKMQVSLLRLIEQKKFNRLGGHRSIRSKARLIAASNANLEELVKTNKFREDLFYRLDVFRINLSPIRQRREDIKLLIEDLLPKYNELFKKNILNINQKCLNLLENYEWPGNVRELKNVIQRAVLVCNKEELLPEHLPQRFRNNLSSEKKIFFNLGTPLDKIEQKMIIAALKSTNNNRTRAAKLLGISRRAIYNKLKKHNIKY
jgi:DNA-binding NtrC family response regulator